MDSFSRIKDIYVELHGYEFYHSPSGIDKPDDRIIGREEELQRLTTLLSQSDPNSGSYLVTGYRGMGKTSLVRKAISGAKNLSSKPDLFGKDENKGFFRHKILKKSIIDIEISLSQDDLTEDDILKLLVRQVTRKYRQTLKPFSPGGSYLSFVLLFILGVGLGIWMFCIDAFAPIFQNTPQDIYVWIPSFWRAPSVLWSLIVYLCLGAIIISSLYYFLLSLLSRIGIVTHNEILGRLQRLSERADSEVTKGTEIQPLKVKLGDYLGITQKKSRVFPVAKGKDLQNELREIFDQLDRMNKRKFPFTFILPRFIIVFDELDKIQPRYNNGVLANEDAITFDATMQPTSISVMATRRRQEAIANILANLKHFFNNAKAKFVIIAGREMFDAALADISDRDSFVGSIFDEVIYLPSFLKERGGDKSMGISGMTERYVCRYLIDHKSMTTFKNNGSKSSRGKSVGAKQGSSVVDLDLAKIAEKRLLKVIRLGNESTSNSIPNSELFKVYSTLQNFISYLNYRSNGTPKKITHLFESFIVDRSFEEIKAQDGILVSQNKNYSERTSGRFLRFKYHDQYRIGLSARLYRPYAISHSRHLKSFSDKILVSTAFLTDHITKYHNTAFNWHHIEHTPELISISKTPDARSFLFTMVEFMEQTYLRKTLSGIFEYKFRPKFKYELIYLSKVNELESAASNFTLDESLGVKRHYKSKLLVTNHPKTNSPISTKEEFAYANSMIHSTLGDLHFFDQEYFDAAEHYGKAIQPLRGKEITDLDAHQFLVLTREQLKLGLSFERQKSFDFAFSHYNAITARTNLWFLHHCKMQKQNVAPQYSNLHQFKSIAETLNIFHQSMVARLHLIEKKSDSGIGYRDILDSEQVYDNVARAGLGPGETEDYLNRASYHLNVGMVLYFKNGRALLGAVPDELSYLRHVLGEIETLNPDSKRIPSSALFEYLIASLAILLRAHNTIGSGRKRIDLDQLVCNLKLQDETKTVAFGIARFISEKLKDYKFEAKSRVHHPPIFHFIQQLLAEFQAVEQSSEINTKANWGTQYLEICGEILTRIGDIMVVSSAPTKGKLEDGILRNILKKFLGQADVDIVLTENSPISFAFECYRLAGKFFGRANNTKIKTYTLRKVIAFCYEISSDDDFAKSQGVSEKLLLVDIARHAMEEKLKNYSRSAESHSRLQLSKAKRYKDATLELNDGNSIAMEGTSAFFEIRESAILYHQFLQKVEYSQARGNSYKGFIRADSPIGGMYERVQELIFKSQINFKSYENGSVELRKKTSLVADSIFVLLEAIRILDILGSGFIIRYSLKATAYRFLGYWCEEYNHLRSYESHGNSVEITLAKLLGSDSGFCKTPSFYYEKSIKYYLQMLDLHSNSRTYRSEIIDLFYLEDDLGDQLSHFSAAVERRRINTGEIKKKIQDLEKYVSPFEVKDFISQD